MDKNTWLRQSASQFFSDRKRVKTFFPNNWCYKWVEMVGVGLSQSQHFTFSRIGLAMQEVTVTEDSFNCFWMNSMEPGVWSSEIRYIVKNGCNMFTLYPGATTSPTVHGKAKKSIDSKMPFWDGICDSSQEGNSSKMQRLTSLPFPYLCVGQSKLKHKLDRKSVV